MPPDDAPTYTVLPEGSDGSTAMAPTRPEISAFSPSPLAPIPAGPTAVNVLVESALVGSWVKMRKLTVAWSATGSPSPVAGIGFVRFSDHELIVPVRPDPLSVISSVQLPPEILFLNTDSGKRGLNVPKKGGPPFWIGVLAVSSNVVCEKSAWRPVWPTLEKSCTLVTPSGAIRRASRSGSNG